MQPYLFPYLGYFQLIYAVDKFILLDDANFMKGSWINRNSLLINNKRGRFNVPLQKSSSFKSINDLYIHDKLRWKTKFLKTISQNYKNAPYYYLFSPILEKIINSEAEKISDLIFISIIEINHYLNLNTPIERASMLYENQSLKGQERVLDICLQEKANHYINAIGGKEIYSFEYFKKNKIFLNFIKSSLPEYEQFQNNFVPGLSIIDVLMFNSKENIQVMLKDFQLV